MWVLQKHLSKVSSKLFLEAGFKLYKVHFNITKLEGKRDYLQMKSDKIYAKQQLSKEYTKSTTPPLSQNKHYNCLKWSFHKVGLQTYWTVITSPATLQDGLQKGL